MPKYFVAYVDKWLMAVTDLQTVMFVYVKHACTILYHFDKISHLVIVKL